MGQFTELKKNDRKFETIEDQNQIFELIKNNYKKLSLYIKFETHKTTVQISQILDDNSIEIITDPDYMPDNKKIIVYGLLEKYIEIDFDIININGPGLFSCKILKVKRAIDIRKELRLKVTPEQATATNFMLSKHTIEITNFKIPTSIKILLEQFHSEHSKIADLVKVDIFDSNDVVLEKIKKFKKILFINDINNPSKQNYAKDIIDANDLLEDYLPEFIKKNIEKGYKSIVIVPVIYVTDEDIEVPFAYVQLISKTKLFSIDDVKSLKALIDKLIVRIKDANTINIQTSQQITNLSKSGAQLYKLMRILKNIFFRQKEYYLIFYLNFRLLLQFMGVLKIFPEIIMEECWLELLL
jgi:hypothetical protein